MPAELYCYADFLNILRKAGFAMGGGNNEGIFSVVTWDWRQEPPYETPVRWHTGDKETDPWEWRIRVLDEKADIAYSKLFFHKSGYITKQWYPCFLALRRGVQPYPGIDPVCDSIYTLIQDNGALPLHIIKLLGGFGKGEKAAFEKAMLTLQRRLYITMCGRDQKRNKLGEEYGWSSTVFCTTEAFWDKQVFAAAKALTPEDATEKIRQQILLLNPDATEKNIKKFMEG